MNLSVIILTKNEEKQIKGCLESVKWVEEILVIDSGSTDKTLEIVKKYTDNIFTDKSDDFSQKRNLGLEKAKGDWVLYVDADERITPELREEIELGIRNPPAGEAGQESGIAAYRIPRKNFYFCAPPDSAEAQKVGRPREFGGGRPFGNHEWPYIEKTERLFKKEKLEGWKGKLHESPIIQGSVGELQNYLLHYTHRDLSSMVEKTIEWSRVEAELRFQAGHPPVVWWRFPRVMLTEFYRSYIKQGGWKAGTAGVIESMYQAFSIFVTYARLWEMQQKKEASIKK